MNHFTEREFDILNLLAEGKTNGEIAKQLYISIHTVKKNLENIYKKTNCNNRVQLIIMALRNNIIKLTR